MENVLKYYQFSDFFEDQSGVFFSHQISYSELNKTHFLIFEKEESNFNLYVAKYANSKAIGTESPEILEVLVKDYNKSIPEHRIALKQYFSN